MGKFKEENGKTRVGKLLETLGDRAAPLAKIALGVTSDLTGLKVLDNLGNMIKSNDSLTDDEKLLSLEMLEMDKREIDSITKRWSSDMTSDSWLSKNVRPITLLYLLVVMTILVIGDSFSGSFTVKEAWITLIESLLITVVLAYFGSRGVEKYKKITSR